MSRNKATAASDSETTRRLLPLPRTEIAPRARSTCLQGDEFLLAAAGEQGRPDQELEIPRRSVDRDGDVPILWQYDRVAPLFHPAALLRLQSRIPAPPLLVDRERQHARQCGEIASDRGGGHLLGAPSLDDGGHGVVVDLIDEQPGEVWGEDVERAEVSLERPLADMVDDVGAPLLQGVFPTLAVVAERGGGRYPCVLCSLAAARNDWITCLEAEPVLFAGNREARP